jgi:peptidoglycan/xylan/chitin deacetylase (PgdA/CDA1 family)
VTAVSADQREQLVLISFDGAHDNRLWQRSLRLGESSGAKFSYFLSCTFLISKADRQRYKAPGQAHGRSNVGFAADRIEALTRLGHVWAAYQSGHEIASHGCGHFDGRDWNEAQWASEFAQFDAELANGWENNDGRAPAGWRRFATSAITGFRAPYLSTGDGLFAALAERGFAYDASAVSQGPVAPDASQPVVRFALPLIVEGPERRPIIAMDYNLFVRHSGGLENPAQSAAFEARALNAFHTAFEAEYTGERRPLQLGFHFVEMNGGAYWRALERFAEDVCRRPDVACVSYEEAMRRITSPAPNPDS